MAEIETVYMSVEGEFLTEFFRGFMLEGKEDKAYAEICLCLEGMTGDIARQILEGHADLVGRDSEITLVVQDSPKYIKELSEVRENLAKKQTPEEKYNELMELTLDMAEAIEDSGHTFVRKKPAGDGMFERKNGNLLLRNQPTITERLETILDDLDKTAAATAVVEAAFDKYAEDVNADTKHVFAPHDFTLEDARHFHWMMSPKGELYKVNYQEHEAWFDEFRDHFPEDINSVYDLWLRGGWVRFSGGEGLGLTVTFDPTIFKMKARVIQMIYRYAGYGVTVDLPNKIEMGLDYKRATRLINEAYGELEK